MSDALPISGYVGAAWYFTDANPFNALSFLAEQIAAGKAFAALVQVKSISGGTATGRPPRASVQPMVNQIDGLGNQVPHGTIYDLPCFRLQGGNGAVVLDPVVGDIGVAVICDRDISNVKKTTAVGGPGSWRQNDWADGCYFGGFLNSAPTQYVGFSGSGIAVVTPNAITLNGNNVTLDSVGNLTVIGDIKDQSGAHGTLAAFRAAYDTHTHSDPQGGNTGLPSNIV